MSVLELCDADVASVQVEVSAADAIRLMRKLSLAGRDPEVTPVRELMTTPVELATISTRPGEALAIMLERHFRHLPVVDNCGKLLGMLSIRNLLEQRIDDLSHELDSLEQYVTNDGPGG
jgi:signal-transduction protein with cAMP-binding, CBS, and nucleotidyltransferase domain